MSTNFAFTHPIVYVARASLTSVRPPFSWCKKHKNVSRSRNIHAMLGQCMFGNGGAAWTGRAFDHVIRSGNLSELVARTQDLVRRGVPDEEDYILAHMTMRYLRIGATSPVRLMQSAMGKPRTDTSRIFTPSPAPDPSLSLARPLMSTGTASKAISGR